MKFYNPTIEFSNDGCHTLRSTEFNTTYHSIHGTVDEASTVFIVAGLKFLTAKGLTSLEIFEMGFGSGFNALMALLFSEENSIPIRYTGIEAYPVSKEIYEELNYTKLLRKPHCKPLFLSMHACEWGKNINLNENFTLFKINERIENINLEQIYDIVFYDAFAPSCQPVLWEEPAMKKMYDILIPGGVLVTYCAKGEFKRVLKRVGFLVESLPGPTGKREITRAIKVN